MNSIISFTNLLVENKSLMAFVLFMVLFLYNITQFYYYHQLMTPRFSPKLTLLTQSLLLAIISYSMIQLHLPIPLMYILLCLISWQVMLYYYRDSKLVIFAINIDAIFTSILTRDILIGITSLITQKTMYALMNNSINYMLAFCGTRILLFLLLLLINALFPLQQAKKLIRGISHLKPILFFKGTLVFLMLTTNYVDFYLDDARPSTIPFLLSRAVILLCYICIFVMEVQQLKFREAQYNNELISSQLEYQKELYKKRNQYAKVLRTYNHDFKSLLTTLHYLLNQGDVEKAKQLLAEMNEDINLIITENQTYSNRLIVDIILNDLAENCKKNQIAFQAECLIPETMLLKDVELSRIFSNLANNAYEACLKHSDIDKRKITFKSFMKNNSLVIIEQNTFSGEIIVEKNKLKTTKSNKELHGVGIDSIKEMVSSLNGIALIDIEEQSNLFTFYIKIPLE